MPREFIDLLGAPAPATATATAREYIVLGLFQEARISGGKAAELLGLTREGFVAWLARQGMPYFRLNPQEWEGEVARIRAANTPAA